MATDSLARSIAVAALSSGGGSGAVSSVNGKTGTVTLYGTDINMSTDTSLPTVTEQISSNKTNIGEIATQLGGKQDTLTAGSNVQINNNVISATDTTYTAGTNITIDSNNVISATGGGSSYTAGDGIEIANNVISTDDDYIATIPSDGAYQLISNDGQLIEGDFVARTTGGSASISEEGNASFIKWEGNSTNPTYAEATVSLVNPTNATVNSATYIAYAKSQGDTTGTKVFNADDANYGITLNGDASATASYTVENLGTIVNATPTSFTSLGFNLYDHTNTRIYTITGNRYQVFGTYTSVGSETIETNVAVGSYTIPYSFVATVTGYQTVVGGNSTDTMVSLVWSGYNYNHTYEAYDAETITFTDVTGWGMPRVNGVADEIDFEQQKYIKRIGRDVVANKDLYDNKIYDSTYVYYVLSEPVESSLTITQSYTANDFGEEIFAGTSVPVIVEILYGQNLKDKLRTDVLTISAQSLEPSQLNQVYNNLELGCSKTVGYVTYVNAAPTSHSGYYTYWYNLINKSSISKSGRYKLDWTFDGVDYSFTTTSDLSDDRRVVVSTGGVSFFYFSSDTVLAAYMLTSGTYVSHLKWSGSTIETTYTPISSNLLPTVDKPIIYGTGSYGSLASRVKNSSGELTDSTSSGVCSIALGSGSVASAQSTIAIGQNTSAYGNGSLALSGGIANGSYDYVIGSGATATSYSSFSVAIGASAYSYGMGDASIGYSTRAAGKYGVALGGFNNPFKGDEKSASVGVSFAVGDYCWYNNNYYICKQARTLASLSDLTNSNYFQTANSTDAYLLSLGNGSTIARSNALTVDWNGNLVCNNIPAPPSTDGTYNLQCSIVDGVITYSWVAA